ncbi:MAG TPA: hypothetical protein VIV57_13470 [Anaeromyxobacter sp.]
MRSSGSDAHASTVLSLHVSDPEPAMPDASQPAGAPIRRPAIVFSKFLGNDAGGAPPARQDLIVAKRRWQLTSLVVMDWQVMIRTSPLRSSLSTRSTRPSAA